jgi:hypothetical protein
MARIRTIKPEFPQSESMGRCSRDARLLFVNLFTLVDDSGVTRGNSRMLASLLFPYDDDAPRLITGWIVELVKENCIVVYQDEGQTYLQIINWLNHQKIDKPTPSKLPQFDSSREDSRILPVGREGKGRDQGKEGKASATFVLPDWLNKSHWDMWIKARKKMTTEQMQAQVDKLAGWRSEGLDFSGALANAGMNGSQGLFLPNLKAAGNRKLPTQDNFAAKDYGTGVNPL